MFGLNYTFAGSEITVTITNRQIGDILWFL